MKRASNIQRGLGWALGIALLAFGATSCIVIPPPVESNFNRGVEAYDEGKVADAIRFYKLAIAKDPSNHFARYNLAVAYQDQEKYEQAAEQYRLVLKEREDTNSRINLATILYAKGKTDEAMTQLRQAAEKNKDDPNPLSVLGHYLEESGKHAEAMEAYRSALAIDEEHAESHFRKGRLEIIMGRHNVAEDSLIKAVELDDEKPAYLELLAEHYLKLENPLSAIDMLERVSVLESDRVEVFIKLGDLYKDLGYHRQAADRYWQALGIEPDNAYVHRMLKDMFEHLAEEERKKLDKLDKSRAVAQTPST